MFTLPRLLYIIKQPLYFFLRTNNNTYIQQCVVQNEIFSQLKSTFSPHCFSINLQWSGQMSSHLELNPTQPSQETNSYPKPRFPALPIASKFQQIIIQYTTTLGFRTISLISFKTHIIPAHQTYSPTQRTLYHQISNPICRHQTFFIHPLEPFNRFVVKIAPF